MIDGQREGKQAVQMQSPDGARRPKKFFCFSGLRYVKSQLSLNAGVNYLPKWRSGLLFPLVLLENDENSHLENIKNRPV